MQKGNFSVKKNNLLFGVVECEVHCGLKKKSLLTKNVDNFIKSTLFQIEDKNFGQNIEATIQHFDKELSDLISQKQSLMSDLEGFSTAERFQFLSHALKGFSIKEKSDLDSGKAKKLNNLITQKSNSSLINSQTSDPWIPHLNLSSVEKNFILNNDDLCDRIMDSGMSLLNQEFLLILIFNPQHSIIIYFNFNPANNSYSPQWPSSFLNKLFNHW